MAEVDPDQLDVEIERTNAREQRCIAYRRVFEGSDFGQTVLADLYRAFHGGSTTFHPDPYQAARRAGLRDAWLHIQGVLGLDLDQERALRDFYERNRVRMHRGLET